jgi:hypothetical protein
MVLSFFGPKLVRSNFTEVGSTYTRLYFTL